MSQVKNKTHFSNIWKLLLEADTKLGFYSLQKPPEKKTLREWFYRFTWARHAFLFHLMSISTLITTNFKLISVIFLASMESVCIALYITLIICVTNKKSLIKLLGWCKGLYDVEKKFHPLVQNLAEIQLISMERQTTKILKWFGIFIIALYSTIFFGWLILSIILPESIFPKFTPVIPLLNLPFEQKDNWTAYLVTMFVQTLVMFDIARMMIYIFSALMTVVLHVLGVLNLIDEVAKCLGREITNKNDDASFNELMKVINEMISDVSAIISLFSKFCSVPFLTIELASFASVFICGLCFTVLRQYYVFAIEVTIAAVLLWLTCYINEMILDKIEDIKKALYDIPWYALKPKQRKTLLITLNCDKIQKGFTAAGIHDLTMERFGTVVKVGYTNMLILKDLVQK